MRRRHLCPAAGAAPVCRAQGSIALDGVSLTVSDVTEETFAVSLIPTTLELTTLGRRHAGDEVNVEVDVLAKYVESMLASSGAVRS